MRAMWDSFLRLMHDGGPVMWPLLAMSLVSTTLVVERLLFWVTTNSPARLANLRRMAELFRNGRRDLVRELAQRDPSVYGAVARRLLDERVTEALAVDAVEQQRHRMERFMPTLSTIISAAPMLGILGTVTGIIAAFHILSTRAGATAADPRGVSAGIAEALITTAAGLVIAVGVLFPYNAFRAQIDRTLGRLEALISAATGQGPSQASGQPARGSQASSGPKPGAPATGASEDR